MILASRSKKASSLVQKLLKRGHDGNGRTSLGGDTQNVTTTLESLPSYEVADFVAEASARCSECGRDCSADLELYNPELIISCKTNIPVHVAQSYLILSKEACSPFFVNANKYKDTDFTYFVKFTDPFEVDYGYNSENQSETLVYSY